MTNLYIRNNFVTLHPPTGELSEWLKEPASKTGLRASATGVRIPHSPHQSVCFAGAFRVSFGIRTFGSRYPLPKPLSSGEGLDGRSRRSSLRSSFAGAPSHVDSKSLFHGIPAVKAATLPVTGPCFLSALTRKLHSERSACQRGRIPNAGARKYETVRKEVSLCFFWHIRQ